MTFKELQIVEPILRALEEKGYTQPTPIQEQAIPILLEGKDLMGCAQTGTGKTAAFTIPILQHIYNRLDHTKGKRKIKSLIVSPLNKNEFEVYLHGETQLYKREELAEFLHVLSVLIDHEDKFKPDLQLIGLDY